MVLKLFVAALVVSGANAQGPVAPAKPVTPPSQGDKVKVDDLEGRYWTPKDQDYGVVQSRKYSKAKSVSGALSYGSQLNDSWSDGPTLSGSVGYYFSERYGVELQYLNIASKDNKATSNLKSQGGTPNHNKMKAFYGAAFNWVPFYAKMSFLNSSIIYFDMSISPVIGMTNYEQQIETGLVSKTTPTLGLDISQHFFLSKYFAFRMDYKTRFYQEDVASYRTSGASARPTETQTAFTSFLLFGVNFYY